MATNRLERGPWIGRLGRAGFAAMGVSYGIVAILAIKLALRQGGDTTSRQGALRDVARHPFGKALLVLLAIGFAGYALWRLAEAALDLEDHGDDAKGLAVRAGYVARAAIYAGLLWTAIAILTGSGGGGGSKSAQKHTGGVLGWPGGRELVIAAGLAIVDAGLWNGYRGVSHKFEKKLKKDEMNETERRWTRRVGTTGLLSRMVVFGLVGVFLARGAVRYDRKEAIGVDGALAKLAHGPAGSYLLGLVAFGLLAYGVFCVLEARYREV